VGILFTFCRRTLVNRLSHLLVTRLSGSPPPPSLRVLNIVPNGSPKPYPDPNNQSWKRVHPLITPKTNTSLRSVLSCRLSAFGSLPDKLCCVATAFSTSVSGFRLLVVLRPTRKLLLKWTFRNENETEPKCRERKSFSCQLWKKWKCTFSYLIDT